MALNIVTIHCLGFSMQYPAPIMLVMLGLLVR